MVSGTSPYPTTRGVIPLIRSTGATSTEETRRTALSLGTQGGSTTCRPSPPLAKREPQLGISCLKEGRNSFNLQPDNRRSPLRALSRYPRWRTSQTARQVSPPNSPAQPVVEPLPLFATVGLLQGSTTKSLQNTPDFLHRSPRRSQDLGGFLRTSGTPRSSALRVQLTNYHYRVWPRKPQTLSSAGKLYPVNPRPANQPVKQSFSSLCTQNQGDLPLVT